MEKRKYDSSVVMLYLLGQEHLLPGAFRKQIPYSTISSWRKNSLDNFIGSEFRFLFDSNWDNIPLKSENKKLKHLIRAIIKCFLVWRVDLQKLLQSHKGDKGFRSKILLGINLLKPVVGLPLALKIFSIHRTQFYEWSAIEKKRCAHSFSSLCVKRYPRQLQKREVDKIKRLLSSPKYLHWPIVSIAAQGLRTGTIVASLYSWYKYARLLNIQHDAYPKTLKLTGLVAQKPNEYLHIDTTYYYISEGKRACITFVMDNYSKMVLGYAVGEKLSFTLIKTAITEALATIQEYQRGEQSYLVTDGGKENHNQQIEHFLAELSGYQLIKLRALKDIQFSNSPIEAIHRIMKGRYLKNRKFETLEGLDAYVGNAVYDYNYVRPHYKHAPKTPGEAYYDVKLTFNVEKRKARSLKSRIKKNVENACTLCQLNNPNTKVSPASFSSKPS